ncbi:MAG: hypothetical protein QOF33_2937 [Thermomicrobiales bacterium]|jgi:CheY-like chemotaxis protein|nr:hypothetical protein [Thermomicrobiales bacterium]
MTLPPQQCTVLVVDDDPLARHLLGRLLAGIGFAVQAVEDGLAALAAVAAAPPDLILSDVQMPGLDGPGLIHELRRRGQAVPVVLASADPDAGRLLPDVPFLAKPVDPTQLAALVTALLAAAPSLPLQSLTIG